MYLNEEPDYTGGKIYFPNQDFSYQPKKYSAVFFPGAGSEYIHGITTVTSGDRYTALYMHTSLPDHADPDFLGDNKNPQWEAMRYPLAKL
jgi:predicted 2-oxoglutarate/Fe(II)-dependent dioxygenase YbiX